MKKRIGKALVAALACSLALGGCGGTDAEDLAQTTEQPLPGTIIKVYGCEPSRPLIPSDTADECGGQLVNAMFSRLVRFDSKGKPQNDLAEEITHNERMTRYTIRLVDGRSFSDGSPVRSSSFTRAWSWAANPVNGQAGSMLFSNIRGYEDLQQAGTPKDAQLSGLKIVDDLTFTVDLSAPSATFPILVGALAYAPLPQSFYKDPVAFGSRPVTSGPYRFESWAHRKMVKIRRSATYTGDIGIRNAGVDFLVYSDPASALSDVQAGRLDVITTVPDSARKSFVEDSSLQSYNKAGSGIELLTIPTGMEHFGQDREGRLRRRAISMAIDRRTLIEETLDNLAQQPTDFTSPTIPGWSEDLKGEEHLRYRAEAAREAWSQADAIRMWPHDRSLPLICVTEEGTGAFYEGLAASVRNALGIDVEVRTVPTRAALLSGLDKGEYGQVAFPVQILPDYPSPEAYLNQGFVAIGDGRRSPTGSDVLQGRDPSGYASPVFENLLKKAGEAQGVDEANGLYQEAEETLLEDLPSIPLFTVNNVGAGSRRVRGMVPGWNGWPSFWDLSREEQDN